MWQVHITGTTAALRCWHVMMTRGRQAHPSARTAGKTASVASSAVASAYHYFVAQVEEELEESTRLVAAASAVAVGAC